MIYLFSLRAYVSYFLWFTREAKEIGDVRALRLYLFRVLYRKTGQIIRFIVIQASSPKEKD